MSVYSTNQSQNNVGALSISNPRRGSRFGRTSERTTEKSVNLNASNSGSSQNMMMSHQHRQRSGGNFVEYVKSKLGNELKCSQEKYDVLDRKLIEITG